MSFVDSDLSDGNQSFTFTPTSIESFCAAFSGGIAQFINAAGIYTPANGNPIVSRIEIILGETQTPGEDDYFSFQIEGLFGDVFVTTDIEQPIPDESLLVTNCP
jgi:hypothetical protein